MYETQDDPVNETQKAPIKMKLQTGRDNPSASQPHTNSAMLSPGIDLEMPSPDLISYNSSPSPNGLASNLN